MTQVNVFDGLADMYQSGALDANLDDVFSSAAVSGIVLLPGEDRPYTTAASGEYDVADLLLPVDFDTWHSITAAFKAGMSIFPKWFRWNGRGYFEITSQDDFCNAFIHAHKLTRENGSFYADGKPIADDEIKNKIRQSLSIVKKDAARLVYGHFQALQMICKKATPEAPETPRKTSVESFDDFIAKIQTEAYRPIPTGMPAFDRLLRGGIPRQALVVLTAAPGIGKTTLTQQIFEASAANGTDVVFMNLEMSREQLLARSLSRLIHRQGGNISADDIMRGYKWTDAQRAFIEPAAARYREEIAPRMQYNPNTGTSLTAIMTTLNNAAADAKAAGKRAPVAVLDYLHLVTADGREEQQELIKRTVAALKRWAIEFDTFVFVISANNRTSNKSPKIALSSARDSSSIEYTGDIVLSLNYKDVHEGRISPDNPDEMEKLQHAKEKEMIIQVLKARMVEPGGKLYLDFDAENSEFIPKTDGFPAPPDQGEMEFPAINDPDLPNF